MAKRIFILGGGRFGKHLATRLSESGCEVVIGDCTTGRIKDLSSDGFHGLELDTNDEAALKDSGAVSADVTVVAIGENMQASILATLLLKQLGAKRVIARALDLKHAQVLERLGTDEVILPIRDMAYRLAERLSDGHEGERHLLTGAYHLAEITLGPKLSGRPLDAATLRAGDVLWVVGQREKLNRFERDCGPAD